MAKTVFGMPGMGNKLPGDGKKPSGSVEGQTGGSPSQQSKPADETASAQGPAMAKPVNVPMAKPADAPKPDPAPAPAEQAEGSAKTMFGMPAMKLPKQTPPAARPPSVESSPGLAATQAVPAARPAGSSGAGLPGASSQGEDMGFNATVLGVAVNAPTAAQPALTADVPSEPSVGTPSADTDPASMDIVQEDFEAPVSTPPEASAPAAAVPQASEVRSFRAGGGKEANTGSKKLGIIILGVAGLLVAAYLVLYFLWPSLTTPDPQTAPALPGAAVTAPDGMPVPGVPAPTATPAPITAPVPAAPPTPTPMPGQ